MCHFLVLLLEQIKIQRRMPLLMPVVLHIFCQQQSRKHRLIAKLFSQEENRSNPSCSISIPWEQETGRSLFMMGSIDQLPRLRSRMHFCIRSEERRVGKEV